VSPAFDLARSLLTRIYVGLDHLPTVMQSAPQPGAFATLAAAGSGAAAASPPLLRAPSLLVLEDSVKLRRSLKLLDSNPARECHKVGVIYCGEAQDTQRALLANEHGSPLYEAFLAELGVRVSTASHAGFLGGLDCRSTGSSSVYWCSSTLELMFHAVTLMPSRSLEADEQQIHKKRQVGNDHVHVVWAEYGREYRPTTISSQFNDAHIVIYPIRNHAPEAAATDGPSGSSGSSIGPLPPSLSSALFRIAIFSKASVPAFGPLQDGMVVRGASLPALVRLTALNATRAIRHATAGYGRPLPTRRKYIEELLAKHQPSPASTGTTQAHAHSGGAQSTAALSALIMPLLLHRQ